jgi:hypothetical protein
MMDGMKDEWWMMKDGRWKKDERWKMKDKWIIFVCVQWDEKYKIMIWWLLIHDSWLMIDDWWKVIRYMKIIRWYDCEMIVKWLWNDCEMNDCEMMDNSI